MQPTLFLSHGSPMMPLEDIPARAFIASLGQRLERPKAILLVSAHWDNDVPTLTAAQDLDTIHDFYGFPPALYALSYPAHGAPELAETIADLLGDAGLRAHTDATRGLDHGAWVPLMLMYPQADVPVIQLSIQSRLGPGHHIQLGRALAALREQNVLIIASGGFTHNLRALHRHGPAGEEPQWASEFSDWMHHALTAGRTCDLVSYRRLAPHAAMAHPTDEHLLPLFVALGAAGPDAKATRLHSSATLGALRLDAYAFN
ncbi:MAG: dioxygenase [Sphingomonadales bacterium]|nr:dioxygenase [Sphingomonadales bacterium]MDE2169173.1 dioxygenase [Sphingomonadales bacterium]